MMATKNWSTRAFEWLLGLYPRSYRDEYGREIAMLFADRYRHAVTPGERALVWIDSLTGLAMEAPKEHCRMFIKDLGYAIRSVRRQPLFAATIILTLALGIGANSAIFSLLNTVSMRSLPLANPGELYSVRLDSAQPVPQRFSWPVFERLRAATPGDSLAAMGTVAKLHARSEGARELEAAGVQLVSGEYFGVLKAPVAMGRPLMPADNIKPGAHPVAVISHSYWQRRFGGSGDVLSRSLALNSVKFTIVGVAAEGFTGVWLEAPADAWIPLAMQGEVRYSQNYSASNAKLSEPWMPQEQVSWLSIVVRTRDAASATAAINQPFASALLARSESINDLELRKLFLQQRLALEPFSTGFSRLRDRFVNPLYILMGMAAVVLLIACANAANLLLARAVGRQREIALRLSLGAGRLRVVQQLLTESMLLVIIAGVVGLLVSHWASTLLVQMAIGSGDEPAPFRVETDARVLGFTMGVSVLTTLLFGLAPAIRSTRAELADTLKSGSRSIVGGDGSGHAKALVVMQVAFSLTLVSATGLLLRSFQNLATVDLGFEQKHILTADVSVKIAGSNPEELHRRMVERIRQLPGVQSASVAMCGVLRGCRAINDGYTVEGYQPAAREEIAFLVNFVGPDYFDAMGMRLMEGRLIDRTDTDKSPQVAVVNEALARRYFGQKSAIGRRFGQSKRLNTQIAGVVRDARVLSAREEAMPSVFYPLSQVPGMAGSVLEIRTAGDPRLVIGAVRRALTEVAPEVPVGRVTAMADQVSSTLGLERLVVSLSSAFGSLALGLAGFGLFGILSFAVARRAPEFGIRIALGASSGRVLWSVCRDALMLVLAGVAIGLPAVWFSSGAIRKMLFGVSPHDWSVFGVAGLALFAVAAAAALLPAWRASRTDPLTALRMD
jgi:predicted permease